ncbi:hypothetical protein Rai3103_03790 [Raineyella fluvialis]|uniref:Uncharacterized protein n=1 Tax=Raineyella fluvialis TaxID=2662261 RepID=A0A5Q2F7G0_9ACTN|nr:hypothetical protein Rai3103_03790 [Raineyella fluvialis]
MLVGATRLDGLFIWRGMLLSLSYIPGRGLDYGQSLSAAAARIRDTFSPAVQWAVLAVIAWWWHQDALRRRAERNGPAPTLRDRWHQGVATVNSYRDAIGHRRQRPPGQEPA